MLKIVKKIEEKSKSLCDVAPITIAFLGDSVTQGCFECYLTSPTTLETIFDYKSAYSTRVKEILNFLYPNVQINIINSGISGDNACAGLERVERDVLLYHPDLVVVSYGLNDSAKGREGISEYRKALSGIFEKIKAKEIETIFITQNVMNTKVSPHLKDNLFIELAHNFSANIQNNGVLHSYFEAAKEVCEKYGVKICDLHNIWEKLGVMGVDTTELLANKLNHPCREFHYYMAIKLLEVIFEL